MPDPTLLDVIKQRFGVAVDPDSDGGQILNSLTPLPNFDDQSLEGKASAKSLTFTPTANGVSVRAAKASDALVLELPSVPVEFTLIPPGGDHPTPQVELTLLEIAVPLPFLRPARKGADSTLKEAGGGAYASDLLQMTGSRFEGNHATVGGAGLAGVVCSILLARSPSAIRPLAMVAA
jgi:hypothetical protein